MPIAFDLENGTNVVGMVTPGRLASLTNHTYFPDKEKGRFENHPFLPISDQLAHFQRQHLIRSIRSHLPNPAQFSDLFVEIVAHNLCVVHSPPVRRRSLGNVIANTLERKDHQFLFTNFGCIADPKGKKAGKTGILVCSALLVDPFGHESLFLPPGGAIRETSRTVNLRCNAINRKLAT